MSHLIPWTGKANLLALAVIVGVAIMTVSGMPDETTTVPDPGAAMACTADDDRGHEIIQADARSAVDLCQTESAPEPVAVCRLRPECWTNEECDAACGVGLGKCVHSNCPVRICRCR